jgi:hypothetical protein
VLRQVQQPGDADDQVQQQVGGHQTDGDPDRLPEPLEEDRAEDGDEEERDRDLLPLQHPGGERVLQDVRRRVGRREGDGDDEVGGDEAEQDEDEQLAPPPGEQPLQHGDGTLAVGALPGDPAVHRQGPEQGEEHQDERRHRREQPRGQEGDPRLIPQGGEVVHPGQAHHLPPAVLAVPAGGLVRARRLPPRLVVQEPAGERAGGLLLRGGRRGHRRPPAACGRTGRS